MKNKKLGNLKFRTRKLGVFIVIMLMLTVGISGVIADITYKFGTDGSGDSWDGAIDVIRNSNNKVWEIDGIDDDVEIQLAIYDLNDTGGIVKLPMGTITVTTQLEVISDVTLEGMGKGKAGIFSSP